MPGRSLHCSVVPPSSWRPLALACAWLGSTAMSSLALAVPQDIPLGTNPFALAAQYAAQVQPPVLRGQAASVTKGAAKIRQAARKNALADEDLEWEEFPEEEVYDPEADFWSDLGLTLDPAEAFATYYDAPPESWVESYFLMVSGLSEALPISIVGGEYSVDFEDYTSEPGGVVDGSIVIVRLLTPTAFAASATATLKIGQDSYPFSAVNITETDLASLLDLFGAEEGGMELVDGEAWLNEDLFDALALEDDAPDNAIMRLGEGVDAAFDNPSNTSDLKLSAKSPSQWQTVGYQDGSQRSTLLRLLKGYTDVQMQGDSTLVPINDPTGSRSNGQFSALAGSKDTRFELRTSTVQSGTDKALSDNGDYEAWVKGGQAEVRQLASGGTAGQRQARALAQPVAVFGGETAAFDNKGTLKRVRIGSLDGNQSLPGDPLALPLLDVGVKVPKLSGAVPRLGGDSLLTVVREALDARFGGQGTVSYDAASGVVSYTLNGATYRYLPLGAPTVAAVGAGTAGTVGTAAAKVKRWGNRFAATNAGNVAAGAFSLTARGVQLSLTSALGYFTELEQAVKQLDAAGKLRLRSSGLLQVSLGGAEYLVRPGSQIAAGGTAGPAFAMESDGTLLFRDSRGQSQALYPAFADLTVLERTVKSLDPTAVLTDPGTGSISLKLAGQQMRLKPSLKLSPVPPARANELFWQEGPLLYLRYPDNTAQAFSL